MKEEMKEEMKAIATTILIMIVLCAGLVFIDGYVENEPLSTILTVVFILAVIFTIVLSGIFLSYVFVYWVEKDPENRRKYYDAFPSSTHNNYHS